MITEVTTRAGKRIHVLSESDLDVDASGERLRAFCPVHGSDHQRSLSIDVATGWGYCHCCHATIFVAEYDAEIADTLRRGEDGNDRVNGLSSSADTHCASPSVHPTKPRPPATRPQWQRDEVAALCATWPLMQQDLATEQASVYLDERAIPFDVAQDNGLGYLSRAGWRDAPVPPEQQDVLARWIGRIVFPLGSPDGRGSIGRTLVRWEPGMDENQHKAILEAEDITRWIKTNPAGWFGPHPSRFAPTLILVEGGFDRLSLVAAGIPSPAIVALVGTAAKAEWILRFAPQVQRIVLALDGDESGQDAMKRLTGAFRDANLSVDCCPPPPDGWGKDWNERWRRCGESGIVPLLNLLTTNELIQKENCP